MELAEEMIESLLSKTTDSATDVSVQFSYVVSYFRETAAVQQHEKRENPHLKKLLYACIRFKRQREIKHILSMEKQLLDSQNHNGETPILYAAKENQREIVLLLAKEKPNISITSKDGTHVIDLIYEWEEVTNVLRMVCYCIKNNPFTKLMCRKFLIG